MKRIFTTFLTLVTIVIVGTSGIKSVHNSSSPPTGNTGASGAYCNSCHSGNTFNAAGGGITATGLPDGYTLNTVYSFSVTINHASANRKRWGFAIKAVNANGVAVGTFTSSNPNANVSSGELRHLNAPTLATAVSTYTYANLKWAAPATNNLTDKTIRFFIVAVAADGTGGSNADFVYSKLLTVLPATAIKSFTPVKGITGANVNIKGNSFTGATAVSFGGVAAQSFSVNNDSTITAIVASGASGNVSVTSPSGTATMPGFTYCAVTPTTNNTNLFGCNSLVFKDSTYFGSTVVKDTLRTQNGCDSIYKNTSITIKSINPTQQVVNQTACDKFTYKNITYTSSVSIKDTIRTTEGCDSVHLTTNVTINPSIDGRLLHPTKGTISNIKIIQSGTVTSTLNVSGNYNLACQPANSNVIIKPTKNNDITKANGITSVDALLVQRHILNTTKLNNAYKIIAADVTGDKQINSTDVLRMKRLILGTDTTFTSATRGNRLWEFVDSAYTFTDTTNPFPFKDSISFTNLTSNKTNQTFIGVKLGDVNYDWNPTVARGVAAKSLQLIANSEKSTNNDYQLSITSSNFNDIAALQTTLHFDNTKYEFVAIESNKLQIDYNTSKANTTGNIAILWTDKNAEAKSFDATDVLFTIILKPLTVDSKLLTDLQLNNDIAEAEAWDNRLTKLNIVLKQKTAVERLENRNFVYIYPNPAHSCVYIKVDKLESNCKLLFTNYLGKIIKTQSLLKGINTIDISDLSRGMYVVTVVTNNNTQTNKIIVE